MLSCAREAEQGVALCYHWAGSATFRRLDDFCSGVRRGLDKHLAAGYPLVLVGDGDIGGLVGIHAKEEQKLTGTSDVYVVTNRTDADNLLADR